MPKETKTDRIGMRISPEQKEKWEKAARDFGFNSLAAWIGNVLENEIESKSKSKQDELE